MKISEYLDFSQNARCFESKGKYIFLQNNFFPETGYKGKASRLRG